MEKKLDAGTELLAGLLESNMRHEHALFEQGLKVQALELTLRDFSDTRQRYEAALLEARTPQVVQKHERMQQLALAAIAAVRVGHLPSD
jgi:hypothetical protein